ncbi:hypothetical protein Mterra_03577 [Calidithermus terrae]|uniref:Uncharacterized protein n=1 Tax=Calidithermus terrae TaxID=1408545 RepID=A0A399EBN8_9DEIN|nr:hypothetical protein Mterra_03577 [Calidithermus terrae]
MRKPCHALLTDPRYEPSLWSRRQRAYLGAYLS